MLWFSPSLSQNIASAGDGDDKKRADGKKSEDIVDSGHGGVEDLREEQVDRMTG